MAKYIRDLLDLPAQVNRGDFVLNLAAGVSSEQAAGTLHDYVVTPQLKQCFDQALGFVKSAVESRASKACYLHGSFGSGKSHFMAVLHLLLSGNAEARSIPELAEAVARHNVWTQGRKFLLVPFHLIGSRSMEQGILGRYAEYVRQVHPEAPVPGVYLAESLFADARGLCQDMGDTVFFQGLNRNKTGGGGWGSLEAGWDRAGFEAAMAASPGDPERTRLVSDLVGAFFHSYHSVAAGQAEAYLELDKGLAVIAQHAADLGYDALILFLDELILWLASHAADLNFIHRESQKLVKLVEAQETGRPIPIASFVARQRDLRKLIGENVSGALRLNFDDALSHHEGRFTVIRLEDRNLPLIAQKRVLKPRSEAARQELDAAFAQTERIREEVMKILLTDEHNRESFRQTYPFSPALVETLIAVSSLLQRERTALKIMLQLLVDQRDTLQVGDLVPVGDLFDAVSQGDEAFSQDMKVHFDNARKLYLEKLLPILERQHGAKREDLLARPVSDPARINFVNDDRLVKTLLLAALAPGVPSLRALNATRLAALNHGTIKAPIAGKEAGIVLQKCRSWAAEVGEIKVGDEALNPTLSVQLSGVDTDAILEAAAQEDNFGNRLTMVRKLLFEDLEIEDKDNIFYSHEFSWRNTDRACDIVFGNVRALPEMSLTAADKAWKVVIDYPFDEPGHTSHDDIGKLQLYTQNHPAGTRTLVWLPAFFSEAALRDLGRLVVVTHVMTGERFGHYAASLSVQDRNVAKTILENQKSSLYERVKQHLEAAYGIRGTQSSSIDPAHELTDTFQTLYPGLPLQPPAASTLKEVLGELLGQALGFEFPAHPAFGAETKRANLAKVLEVVRGAASESGGRVAVDKGVRNLVKQIAEPLKLGEQGETHFVLGQHWKDHFSPKAAAGGGALTVQQLRRWIDEPKPMGLPRECANLIILIFAAQTSRSFACHGAPYDASLTNLPDEAELREQKLPAEAAWKTALDRAAHIFGLTGSPHLNAANLAKLTGEIQKAADLNLKTVRTLATRVRGLLLDFHQAPEAAARSQTAETLLELLESVTHVKPAEVVEALVGLTPRTSAKAMGACLSSAVAVTEAINTTPWKLFETIRLIQDERTAAVQALLGKVAAALGNDQYVTPLEAELKVAQNLAIDLLKPPIPPTPLTVSSLGPAVPPAPVPVGKPDRKIVGQGKLENVSLEQAENELIRLRQQSRERRVTRVNVSWIIEEE